MAGDVIIGGYFELNSVDYSKYVESFEPNFELEVLESRPYNSGSGTLTAVAKEPGLANNSFTITTVEDTAWAFFIALDAIKGTKVAWEVRPDDAAKGATNPRWYGTGDKTGGAIVPHTVPAIQQGQLARTTITFQVDGPVTFDNT